MGQTDLRRRLEQIDSLVFWEGRMGESVGKIASLKEIRRLDVLRGSGTSTSQPMRAFFSKKPAVQTHSHGTHSPSSGDRLYF
jgi:hypothetical protein